MDRTVKVFEGTDQFEGNAICTSKYTWCNFVIKNLCEQLRQLANIYFVVMLVLQTIKSISPTGGVPTMSLPLSIVMGATAAKDFWEDWKCKRADEEENSRPVSVQDAEGTVTPTTWGRLRPGDVIVLKDQEPVPADVLVLESQDGQGPSHFAYVETKDLDGEADLKQKQSAIPEDWSFQAHEGRRGSVSASFPEPNIDLYRGFNGTLKGPAGCEPVKVSMNNLLLRGSTLQQTERVVGLVTYCGHETRVMLNVKSARFKQSELGAAMNRHIGVIFALQLTVCFVGGILSIWMNVNDKDPWYLLMPDYTDQSIDLLQESVISLFVELGKWVLLLNNMVPISLIVTLNTVTLLQGRFIESDPDMGDPDSRVLPNAEVHCSQVIESLGQVTHVISDKTGTLTRNEMTYKACSVGGQVYGDRPGDKRAEEILSCIRRTKSVEDLPADITEADGCTAETCKVKTYTLLCHAVCHTVTANPADTGGGAGRYQASSVDEIELVSQARKLGLELVKSGRRSGVELQVRNERVRQPLVNVGIIPNRGGQVFIPIEAMCHFDSYRKRMSVVVSLSDRRVLLVKGADSTMLPLLKGCDETDNIRKDVYEFAISGLRTLVMAYRDLDAAWFDDWNRKYQEASTAGHEGVPEMIDQLEKQLSPLCATGIEDRLQDKVGETILHMREAGIVLWVLTGDKAETAINIAYLCNLFTRHMRLVRITEEGGSPILTVGENVVRNENFWDEMKELGKRVDEDEQETGMTITGDALTVIMRSGEQDKRVLHKVMQRCSSVLCCRVSPNQKAQVVQMVNHYHKELTGDMPVTLAVGDGANDVAMINEAHVGVGVAGKEGAQAARTADYAISQFHFLERLLFVHGREAYRRNSILICYSFYKNMILVLPMFFFGCKTNFSGAPLYEQILFQFYNVAFTALPIMAFALFDRQNDDLSQLKDPKMYVPGRERSFFNGTVLLLWMTAALFQAAVLSLAAYFLLGDGSLGRGGFVAGDLWTSGAVVFLWVIVGANITLVARMNTFLSVSVVALAGSILCHPVMLWVTEAAGMGVPVSLQGAVGFIYGAGAPRSLLVSFLALALFCLAGEPFLQHADGLGVAGGTEIQESSSSDSSSCCHYERLTSDLC